MPGYLDQYGAGEEQRNRIVVRTIVGILIALILGALSFYHFQNHHQESIVRTFLAALKRGDADAAYRAWGCSAEKPCSAYSTKNLMEDWGPASKSPPDPEVLGLADSESCNSGVLLTVDVNRARVEKLWVDKNNDSIGFAPYPNCPYKNPWAVMLHRTIGRLRKPLLK